MKIKNALMCGAMAAVMLFAGCGKNSSESGRSDALSGTSDGNIGSGGSAAAYAVSKEAPAEIEGFEGNVGEVTPKSGDLIATFEIEGYGTIKAVLFPQAAPVGVENFQKLCDSGYYKGLNIHRVMSGFMFQGGSKNGNGTGGSAMVNGGKFPIETAQNARHFYGALCYANAGPENNSTQFYIVNNKSSQDIGAYNVDANQKAIDDAVDEVNEVASQYTADVIEAYMADVQYSQNTLTFIKYASDEIRARYKEKGGTPSLDGNYTVFGQVYEGFDVIDAISAAEVRNNGANEISKPVKDIIIKNISVSTFE